ncbi:MAG: GTP 3',8-cyclase MoaA [gamma proteobacterium symbiont of Phacoides pectinatus]
MAELVDRFGRKIEYLRLSVTDRCDFRCFYCIPKGFNEFSDRDDQLTLDEYVRLVRVFSEMGVGRVRFTGGEPLVRRDIVEMVRRIGAMPNIHDLSMSTNASQLARCASEIRAAGVERLNVSLDTLDPETFRQITQGDLSRVLDGLMAAKSAGFRPIKINMVVMRDLNMHEVGDMVDFCLEHRFTLRFIETMPVGEAGVSARDRYVSLAEIRNMLEQRFELEPARMTGAGPAKYLKVVGGRLKIGFITPMSQHFCEDCNRVRLSSEGTLYLCLGQGDKLEFRPLLRDGVDDDELKRHILEAIERKPEKHEFDTKPGQVVRVMSMTGG